MRIKTLDKGTNIEGLIVIAGIVLVSHLVALGVGVVIGWVIKY